MALCSIFINTLSTDHKINKRLNKVLWTHLSYCNKPLFSIHLNMHKSLKYPIFVEFPTISCFFNSTFKIIKEQISPQAWFFFSQWIKKQTWVLKKKKKKWSHNPTEDTHLKFSMPRLWYVALLIYVYFQYGHI